MSTPPQTVLRSHKRRRRRRRTPLFPFVLLAMLLFGLFFVVRFFAGLRPAARPKDLPPAYVSNMAVLTSEYNRYYGKPIEDVQIESRFLQATGMINRHNFPGAIAILENLSRQAAVPVIFTDMGVVYIQLGDYARAADAFREALARDSEYAPARQFLRTTKAIPPTIADPYTREAEPNNEARMANLISLNVPVSGEITAATDDTDYFRVIAPPSPRDLITIELVNHSIGFTPQLHIYDANFRLLSWGETSVRAGESIRVQGGPPPNSSVYISVSSADPRIGGLYVLTARAKKAFDAYEPDDEITSARRIGVGEDIEANIMDGQDNDYYAFQSPRAGTVSIDIRNRSDTLIPAIATYNADHRAMGFGPEIRKPGASLHHSIPVEKDKIYYVQVLSQAGSAGAYTLHIE